MKRKFFLLSSIPLILIVVGLLTGCEKDPFNPSTDTKYTIKAFAVNGTFTPDSLRVSAGSDATLNLKLDDGYDSDSIIVNGIVNELLKGKTIFDFFNIDGDINIEAVPKINRWGVLMQGKWNLELAQTRLLSETNWSETQAPPKIDSVILVFGKKSVEYFKGMSKNRFRISSYSLTADSLIIGDGQRHGIVELSAGPKGKLIIEAKVYHYDAPYVIDPNKTKILRFTYCKL